MRVCDALRVAVLVSLLASAAASGALLVRRAPEAADCPDATSLSAMILHLTPKAPEAADVAPPDGDRFEVEFSRRSAGYRVVVRTIGAHAGVRTLDDPGATCSSLAEAIALTIAVIIDPEGVKLAEPPSQTVEPPAVSPVAPVPRAPVDTESRSAPAPSPRSEHWSLAVAAGGGGAFGIVREAAPVAFLALELRPVRLVSVVLGGTFVPTQSLSLERGSIDVWLVAGAASACFWPYAETLRIGGCIGLSAGSVRGDGRGYPAESGATRPWLAATGAAAVNGNVIGLLGWNAKAELVVPTHRESFGIDGAGVAYQASTLGGIVTVGLSMKIR